MNRLLIYLCCLLLALLPGQFSLLATQNQCLINRLPIDSLKQILDTQKMDKQKESELNGTLGILYNASGKYDSARIYLHKALSLPGGREREGGRLLTNLANTYGFQGKYAEALKYYMEALKASEQQLATIGREMAQNNILRTMANIAEIQYLTGNQKQALYYAERGKKLFYEELSKTNVGIEYVVPQLLYITGLVHLDRNELDKAEEAMQATCELAGAISQRSIEKNGDPHGMYVYIAYGKEGLARVRLARKNYAQALEQLTEALDFAEKHGDPTVKAKMLATFSDLYLEQDNYEASGQYAVKALEMYPAYSKLNPDVAFNIASARLFAGDKAGAYEYFCNYSALTKENTDKQFRETMASMEIQFETEKKEMRIADLEKQNIFYIIAGIICILLAISSWTIFYLNMKNTRKNKQLFAANIILEWEKKERKRFASDLHDGIIGTLSLIKFDLNTVKNLQNIRDRLDDCIGMIRRMSHGMMPTSLEGYGLKAALEDYCRLFSNVDFHFFGEDKRMSENLELAVYYSAYELINNSFRHSGAKNINVQLIQDVNTIFLTVQDDGCGFDKQSIGKGSGLKNIRSRIASFNGKIDIASSPGNGTETSIELQIKK